MLVMDINTASSVTNADHDRLMLIISINMDSSVTIDDLGGSDLTPPSYDKSMGLISKIVYELIIQILQKYVMIFHEK